MKTLIDRDIERNAVVYRSAEVPKSVRWGDRDITAGVLERQAHLPREDESFRNAQLPYLATVGELARAGRVRLFASFELQMERMRQRTRSPGYLGLNLLEDASIDSVESPVGRTVEIGSRKVGVTEDEQMEFFRSIRHPRFLEIRATISDKSNPEAHIDDAFHLWTAEEAGLDAFLTMDQAFIRVMRARA